MPEPQQSGSPNPRAVLALMAAESETAAVLEALGLGELREYHGQFDLAVSTAIQRTRLMLRDTGQEATRILLRRTFLQTWRQKLPSTPSFPPSERSAIRKQLLSFTTPDRSADDGKWLDPAAWAGFGQWLTDRLRKHHDQTDRNACLLTALDLVSKALATQDKAIQEADRTTSG